MTAPHRTARALACAAALLLGSAACDDDPTSPNPGPLTPQVVQESPTDTIIPRQGAIRVSFGGARLDTRSALDPANFLVTDRCTGLRVAGALRLSGDTVIFTPSRALPYLTPLDIRVQNMMDSTGRAQAQPFTFSLLTEAPPVQDISWSELDSPTNDPISGISFVDRNLGYIGTSGGAIYRTLNGGEGYQALFKDADIIQVNGVRAAGPDTIFMTAAPSFGGSTFTTYGLFRSIDGGRSFQPLFTRNPADMTAPSVYRPAAGRPAVVVGGNQGSLTVWRYDTANDSIYQFGPIAGEIGFRAGLSKDGSHAAMSGQRSVGGGQLPVAILYRSTNGGRTYVSVPMPATARSLRDVSFRNGTEAIAVGIRSGVYRVDASTGLVTEIGAAQGIPQTDSSEASVTTYTFTAVTFAPGGQQGWIVGFLTRRVPGQPNVSRGVILQTTDGGQTWTRQAVAGTDDAGLGFEPLFDVFALSADFATTGGSNGFLASRTAESSQNIGVCSFGDETFALTQP